MALRTNSSGPWSWAASDFWDGNDGLWNSFVVRVGTPLQDFRVLPSFLEQVVWVLHPLGCTPNDPTTCPYSRGALPFNSVNNTGLQVNKSSTWDVIGIYALGSYDKQMGYPGNGYFGFDTVALSNQSDALELPNQVVAAVADKSSYLGQFGLGPKPSNFTTLDEPIPNYMATLINESKIPSLSFGYTAGAHYRDKAPASLTLGGHDENRYESSGLSFKMDQDNVRPLQVGIQKILADNTLRGPMNLLPSATFHLIDSTVSHIWLPDDAIEKFVSAFGLTYDNDTELYLVNNTVHEELLEKQPTITFVLAESLEDGIRSTQNIKLPYAAFDLQAGSPFYENKTVNYFPIRQAANNTQYTIGRTFLQEAYVIVDWERQNFTVAQARFDRLGEESLVPILQKASETASNQTSPDGTTERPGNDGIGAEGIAGIAIGTTAFVALVGIAIFFYLRMRRNSKSDSGTVGTGYENHIVSSMQKSPYQQSRSELESRNVNEMPSGHALSEAGGVAKRGRFSLHEAPNTPVGRSELGHGESLSAEAPGDEGNRYELPEDETHR